MEINKILKAKEKRKREKNQNDDKCDPSAS